MCSRLVYRTSRWCEMLVCFGCESSSKMVGNSVIGPYEPTSTSWLVVQLTGCPLSHHDLSAMPVYRRDVNLLRAVDIRFLVCLRAENYGAGRHAPTLIS